jgi:ribosomal protein S6
MDTQTEQVQEGIKVYEIGYHLIPSIPVEKVAGEVEEIKSVIAKHKGSLIAEENPKLRPLAYTIKKAVEGSRYKFNEGYFGWVKFEVDTAVIEEIKKALDANEHILRYLLINTVRENTMVSPKLMTPGAKEEDGKVAAPAETPKPAISEEELEKTINDLVIE